MTRVFCIKSQALPADQWEEAVFIFIKVLAYWACGQAGGPNRHSTRWVNRFTQLNLNRGNWLLISHSKTDPKPSLWKILKIPFSNGLRQQKTLVKQGEKTPCQLKPENDPSSLKLRRATPVFALASFRLRSVSYAGQVAAASKMCRRQISRFNRFLKYGKLGRLSNIDIWNFSNERAGDLSLRGDR